jgi:putative transposase
VPWSIIGGRDHATPSTPVFAERSPPTIQRGNNRQACFFADEDYRNYLDWLGEYAGKTGCRVHAYVLMTNHVHLLISAEQGGSSGTLMKALGQRYVQYVNRSYRRSGTLWEGPLPLLPHPARDVSAGLPVLHRAESSARGHGRASGGISVVELPANAQGEEDALVKPHSLYEALERDAASRQAAYRELFRYELEPGLVDEIRRATNGNYALGNERFAEQVALALGRRAAPGKSGRPRRAPEPESRDLF